MTAAPDEQTQSKQTRSEQAEDKQTEDKQTEDKQTERPHPLTPFIRGWIVVAAVALAVGRELLNDSGDPDGFRLSDLGSFLPVAVIGLIAIAAASGFASWYFTRFVIDNDEFRIETGILFKRSRKVPFERLQSVDIVQPLIARLVGLSELRLEAGAGDGTLKLRYLSRDRAARLREYLLARAHGQQADVGDPGHLPADVFTDLSVADRPIVRVPSARLAISFLISIEFLFTVLGAGLFVVGAVAFGVPLLAFGGLVPLIISTISMINNRVLNMFNFTLAESSRGLRIARGLTGLTSQSVPISRIQGVRISQPLTWRPLGWYRVDIDVVGIGQGDNDDADKEASSILLPVAEAAEVALAVNRVTPGFDQAEIVLRPSPRRSRWLRWYDFWTLKYGWNDRAVVTENGWLTHVRNVVPHAKIQSVRVEQGPLQRKLRIADVYLHTPHGPVNAVAHQVDEDDARTLAITELDRARAARAADRIRASLAPEDAADADVLAGFGLTSDALLGSGGESRVYALDESRVLRIYRTSGPDERTVVDQLRHLYGLWAAGPLELPQILEVGERAGRVFTVDRRFAGQPFGEWLATAEPADRRTALLSYLDAAAAIQELPAPVAGFARLVGPDAPVGFPSLGALLNDQLQRALLVSSAVLDRDVPGMAQIWSDFHESLAGRYCRPVVVHGDVCPSNAYIDVDGAGHPTVSGIGDFSPHTLTADPYLDLTGAIVFLELERYAEASADAAWLEQEALRRWGSDLAHWIGVYRLYYAIYFSAAHDVDAELYAWCLRQLRGEMAPA